MLFNPHALHINGVHFQYLNTWHEGQLGCELPDAGGSSSFSSIGGFVRVLEPVGALCWVLQTQLSCSVLRVLSKSPPRRYIELRDSSRLCISHQDLRLSPRSFSLYLPYTKINTRATLRDNVFIQTPFRVIYHFTYMCSS